MLSTNSPALVLAPMDGITDAPMRALQGESSPFSFAVSEFLRVSSEPLPSRSFLRHVPELANGARTPSGLPVQVQILGGDPGRMARSAQVACESGASAIDINFGCPAPTVNRHDGGASLLRHPDRIEAIVDAIRRALPAEIPVSAKLRLGWDDIDPIFENAKRAAGAGAAWITIHARTRTQGYAPPTYWPQVGRVREHVHCPVVANGDIWSLADFRRCREETGCLHYMLGRGALANPGLAREVALELGLPAPPARPETWLERFEKLLYWTEYYEGRIAPQAVMRLKQWLNLAGRFGDFPYFDQLKRMPTTVALLEALALLSDEASGDRTTSPLAHVVRERPVSVVTCA